jgi:hypothetical protein
VSPAERALLYPFLLCGSNKVQQKDSYKRELGHKKYCTAENWCLRREVKIMFVSYFLQYLFPDLFFLGF